MLLLGIWIGGMISTALLCLLVITVEKESIYKNSTYSKFSTAVGLVLAFITLTAIWPLFLIMAYLSQLVFNKKGTSGNTGGEEFYQKIASDDIEVENIEDITGVDRAHLAENVRKILKNNELEPVTSQKVKEGNVACIKCGKIFDLSLRKCPKCGLDCMTFAGKLMR